MRAGVRANVGIFFNHHYCEYSVLNFRLSDGRLSCEVFGSAYLQDFTAPSDLYQEVTVRWGIFMCMLCMVRSKS